METSERTPRTRPPGGVEAAGEPLTFARWRDLAATGSRELFARLPEPVQAEAWDALDRQAREREEALR